MKSLTFVLEVSCSNEYADVPAKAEVEITEKDLVWFKACLKQIKLLKASYISRWEGVSKFLNDEDVEVEDFRAECEEMKVSDTDFYMKGLVKKCDFSWSTDSISMEELKECWKVAFCQATTLPLLFPDLEFETAKKIFSARSRNEKLEVYTRINKCEEQWS
jgi:hypothetical protein